MSAGSVLQVIRAPLRRYFEGADGRANPLQWFVLDDGECIAGPFTTQREAFAAAQVEQGERREDFDVRR